MSSLPTSPNQVWAKAPHQEDSSGLHNGKRCGDRYSESALQESWPTGCMWECVEWWGGGYRLRPPHPVVPLGFFAKSSMLQAYWIFQQSTLVRRKRWWREVTCPTWSQDTRELESETGAEPGSVGSQNLNCCRWWCHFSLAERCHGLLEVPSRSWSSAFRSWTRQACSRQRHSGETALPGALSPPMAPGIIQFCVLSCACAESLATGSWWVEVGGWVVVMYKCTLIYKFIIERCVAHSLQIDIRYTVLVIRNFI